MLDSGPRTIMAAVSHRRGTLFAVLIMAAMFAFASSLVTIWSGGRDAASDAVDILVRFAVVLIPIGIIFVALLSPSRRHILKERSRQFGEIDRRVWQNLNLHFQVPGRLDRGLIGRSKQVSNYNPWGKAYSYSSKMLYLKKWVTISIPEDAAYYAVFNLDNNLTSTEDQIVSFSVWQYGSYAKVGTFINDKVIVSRFGEEWLARLHDKCSNLLLTHPEPIKTRHGFTLIEVTLAYDNFLYNYAAWDHVRTQAANTVSHLALDIFKMLEDEKND